MCEPNAVTLSKIPLSGSLGTYGRQNIELYRWLSFEMSNQQFCDLHKGFTPIVSVMQLSSSTPSRSISVVPNVHLTLIYCQEELKSFEVVFDIVIFKGLLRYLSDPRHKMSD